MKSGFRDVVAEVSDPKRSMVELSVGQNTTGSGERIAAFGQERQLASVVGTQTAGRLIF
jgi:hypothetical protein